MTEEEENLLAAAAPHQGRAEIQDLEREKYKTWWGRKLFIENYWHSLKSNTISYLWFAREGQRCTSDLLEAEQLKSEVNILSGVKNENMLECLKLVWSKGV